MKTSLRSFNTMRVDAFCKGIIPIRSVDQLTSFLQKGESYRILGGGSNVLLSEDIDAYILHNEIKGIEVVDEDADQVTVKVGGGEIWHALVTWSVMHGLGGIENLALVPGTVGAAPIQNIGAYGVEQSDTCIQVGVVDLNTQQYQQLSGESCRFGYRDSIFKQEAAGQYFITDVTYKLARNPILNVTYGGIKDQLSKELSECTPRDVYDTVVAIRERKLPDPRVLPNTGSFFKNPIVSKSVQERLYAIHGDAMPCYVVGDDAYKIPAAWLIQESGLKGYRDGDAGIYEKHALVLVNHGDASGEDLMSVARHVQATVKDKFDIDICPEVNIW